MLDASSHAAAFLYFIFKLNYVFDLLSILQLFDAGDCSLFTIKPQGNMWEQWRFEKNSFQRAIWLAAFSVLIGYKNFSEKTKEVQKEMDRLWIVDMFFKIVCTVQLSPDGDTIPVSCHFDPRSLLSFFTQAVHLRLQTKHLGQTIYKHQTSKRGQYTIPFPQSGS